MINDPELKAMSEVYDALQNLDGATQKRVVDWVLTKLQSPNARNTKGAKRGPKPRTKRGIPGRKPRIVTPTKNTGAKRGPKPGSKRGPKSGKIGRPVGSTNKVKNQLISKTRKRRGRPRKTLAS